MNNLVNSLIMLFYFFNFTFGFTALVLFSRRFNPASQSAQKSFIQQALFYNIAITFTAIADFLYFFFWKEVSNNSFALGFLSIINISSLGATILWCISFVLLIYKFLGISVELKSNPLAKSGIAFIVLILIYSFLASLFNITPSFFGIVSFMFSYLLLLVCFGYSVFLYKKSTAIQDVSIRKSLRIFATLFIVFSLLNLAVFISIYPLRLFPRIIIQFSFIGLDLLFNSFCVFWAFLYFNKLNPVEEPTNLINVSEDELIAKFQISKRELEVIHLVCSGKSNQEIADLLFISLGTVKNHLYNIYAKMGIKNRTQLAKLF